MIKDRPYVPRAQPELPVIFPPVTKGGLGKGRLSTIEYKGETVHVRLHKYTHSVASDVYGNIYLETSGRVNNGLVKREWICENLNPS